MAKDLKNILLSQIEENKIKEKTPDKLPLNPTAEGWSGHQVRRFLAKSLIDNEGSFLAEFKKKMTEIKTQFEDVFGEGDGNIQGQINSIIQNIDAFESTISSLTTVAYEEPTSPAVTLWYKVLDASPVIYSSINGGTFDTTPTNILYGGTFDTTPTDSILGGNY